MLKERMAKQLLDKEHGKKKRHKPSHRPKEDISDLAATEALKALDEADSYSIPPTGLPKPIPPTPSPIVQGQTGEGQGSTDSSSNEQNIIEETEKLPTPQTDDLETDDAIAGMEEDFNPAPAPQAPPQAAIAKPLQSATSEPSGPSRSQSEPKPEVTQPAFQPTPVSVVQNNIAPPKAAPEVTTPRNTTPYNPRKRWQQVKTSEPTPAPISNPVVQQPTQSVSVVQSNQNHIPQAKQPKLDLNSEPAIIMPSTVPAPAIKQRQQPTQQQQQQISTTTSIQSTAMSGIQPAEFSDEERLKIDERPKIETTPKIVTGHPKKVRRPSLPSTSPKVSPKVVNPEQQRRLSVSSEGSTQSSGKLGVASGDPIKNQRPVIINPPGHATRKLSSVSDGTESPSIKLPSRGSNVYKQPGVIQTPPPKMVVPLQTTQHVTPTNPSKPSMAVRTNTPSQQRMIISPNPNVSPNVIQIVPTGGIPGQSIITGNDGQSRLTHGQPTISRVIHQNPTQAQAQKIGQSATQQGQQAHPTGYIIGTQPYRLATTSGCIVQPSQNIIQVTNPPGGYQQRIITLPKQPNQSPTAKTGQGMLKKYLFLFLILFLVVITPGQVVTSQSHDPAKSVPAYSQQPSTIVYRSNPSDTGRQQTVINSIAQTPHFPIVPPGDMANRVGIQYPIHPGYPTHQPIQAKI